jgi:hypothetical protein
MYIEKEYVNPIFKNKNIYIDMSKIILTVLDNQTATIYFSNTFNGQWTFVNDDAKNFLAAYDKYVESL